MKRGTYNRTEETKRKMQKFASSDEGRRIRREASQKYWSSIEAREKKSNQMLGLNNPMSGVVRADLSERII